MTAYYNEIDPYCADWLRNLMREGLIADGQVDTISIADVTPNDLRAGHAAQSDQDFAWVIGADGKERRVKPGIRLLAHGVPNRVAKLRALGNAIDLRPAAAFIKAVHESI